MPVEVLDTKRRLCRTERAHGSRRVRIDKANKPAGATGTVSRWTAITALGIVFGDLGTSPLYTLQTVTLAVGGRITPEAALGILSLIFWTLILSVSIKYCLLVMRADNHGTGGIMALMSLVGANSLRRGSRVLTTMGLLGAALLYGDGVITPAISVLSAVEGVKSSPPPSGLSSCPSPS